MLDTPNFFWDSEPTLHPLYAGVREYLEIKPRIQVLNERCRVFLDLAEILSDSIADTKMTRKISRSLCLARRNADCIFRHNMDHHCPHYHLDLGDVFGSVLALRHPLGWWALETRGHCVNDASTWGVTERTLRLDALAVRSICIYLSL